MFIAVAIFNVTSLLYQLYMVRNLSPINYGILNSLFSILMIVSIPSSTLQTVVTKFVSTFYASKHHEKINLLLRSFLRKTFIFGLVTFSILFFCSKSISSFLQIDSPVLIVILGVITFFSIILPLGHGGLQGLQKFGYLGLAMIINGCSKLLLGIIFVSIGFGVIGAMIALVIDLTRIPTYIFSGIVKDTSYYLLIPFLFISAYFGVKTGKLFFVFRNCPLKIF